MVDRAPLGFAILILFICVCVLLQVLGTPVGFLDLLASDATVGSSLSEGLTIPPAKPEMNRASTAHFFHEVAFPHYQLSLADSFFHPPLLS